MGWTVDDDLGFDDTAWVGQWLEHLAAVVDRSPNTVAAYRRDLRQVGEHLASQVGVPAHRLRPTDLTADAVAAAMRRWSLGGRNGRRAAASRRRAWSAWSSLCEWLVRQGEIDGNPMGAVGKPDAPRALPRRIEGDAPLRAVLTAAAAAVTDGRETRWPARDRVIVAVAAFCGLRVSELVALDRGSVTSDGSGGSQLLVHGKGNKQRVVPVPAPVDQLIRSYLAERQVRHGRLPAVDRHDRGDAQALLVHVRDGTRMTRSQLEHLVERLYKLAGVAHRVPPNTRVHALRHQAAFDWLAGGASVAEVKDLLGHESMDTTYRYVVADGAALRSAVDGHAELDALDGEADGGEAA